MAVLVEQVGQVLGRGHALFGGPGSSGGGAALDSSAGLARAGGLVAGGQQRIAGLSGAGPAGYAGVAAAAGPALTAAAEADAGLSSTLREATAGQRAGQQASGSVITGAAADTAVLAPATRTAAGQRALILALRTRVAQQQQLIAAQRVRDARLAALVRSLGYTRSGGGGGGMPAMGAMPFAGGGRVGGGLTSTSSPLSALSGLSGLTSIARLAARNPRTGGGGGGWPAGSIGTPLGALTLNSSRREVASALIHEANRRGYSPQQTTAILADAIQESNLKPRAVSPNGLWESIFQQDSSYPGRRNPNLAIAEFFNRLDHHGGPSSPDIWKSIFWLQQRPADPSADIAYARGRQGYLAEIMGRHQQAIALYREIVRDPSGLTG